MDAFVSLGRAVGPDKTGHFQTLLVWEMLARVGDTMAHDAEAQRRDAAATLGLETLAGVWDEMAAESIMMLLRSVQVVRPGVPV